MQACPSESVPRAIRALTIRRRLPAGILFGRGEGGGAEGGGAVALFEEGMPQGLKPLLFRMLERPEAKASGYLEAKTRCILGHIAGANAPSLLANAPSLLHAT